MPVASRHAVTASRFPTAEANPASSSPQAWISTSSWPSRWCTVTIGWSTGYGTASP
jgi:hypothetical protein